MLSCLEVCPYTLPLPLSLVAVIIMLIAVGVQREKGEEIFEWIYLDNERVHLSLPSVPFVFSIDWTWIKRTNEEDNIVHPHMYAVLNSHRHEKRNNRKRLSDRCTSTEQTRDGDIHDASSRRVDGCCYSYLSIAERTNERTREREKREIIEIFFLSVCFRCSCMVGQWLQLAILTNVWSSLEGKWSSGDLNWSRLHVCRVAWTLEDGSCSRSDSTLDQMCNMCTTRIRTNVDWICLCCRRKHVRREKDHRHCPALNSTLTSMIDMQSNFIDRWKRIRWTTDGRRKRESKAMLSSFSSSFSLDSNDVHYPSNGLIRKDRLEKDQCQRRMSNNQRRWSTCSLSFDTRHTVKHVN